MFVKCLEKCLSVPTSISGSIQQRFLLFLFPSPIHAKRHYCLSLKFSSIRSQAPLAQKRRISDFSHNLFQGIYCFLSPSALSTLLTPQHFGWVCGFCPHHSIKISLVLEEVNYKGFFGQLKVKCCIQKGREFLKHRATINSILT